MTEGISERDVNRKDLKIQALRERLAQITVQYEDRDADKRIIITEHEQLIENLQRQLQAVTEQLNSMQTEGLENFDVPPEPDDTPLPE